MKSRLIYFGFILLLFGCNQNPKACLELEPTYEVGREYQLTSCSKNYEFLTWDFGDRSGGFIGDEAPHIFQNEGDFTVTLEAFSDGAYNSDVATQVIQSAHRYVDQIHVIGNADYKNFRFEFGQAEVLFRNVEGTYTEGAPYVGSVIDSASLEIPMDKVQISLFGLKNSTSSPLVNKSTINFRNNVENPVILNGTGFTMEVYWSYP